MKKPAPHDGTKNAQGAVADTASAAARDDSVATRIDSDTLFDGRQVVVIVHAGQDYVLRVTRNGKLILTK